jgi:hypothetical protein
MNSVAPKHLPIAAALMLTALAYLVPSPELGWLSDDYTLVFGTALRPWPTLGEALRIGGQGALSVHRPLCYPLIGYIAGWLGTPWAHVLQAGFHLLCAFVCYLLLRRLRWATAPAALATAGFGVAPWISQPVFWWSAVCTIVSSILVLLAVHAYVSWRRGNSRRPLPLLACLVFAFTSLLLYELWLAGFVLFWTVEAYLQRIERPTESNSWPRSILLAVRHSWPVLTPYFVWAVIFRLTYHGSIHQPHVSLVRIPLVLFSIHLRVYHWLADTPWVTGLRNGMEALATKQGIITLAALLATIVWFKISHEPASSRVVSDPSCDSAPVVFSGGVPLAETLFLAWGIFLASRLVFVLQGGIATHTRHNYGAAIGAAIAGVAVLIWLQTLQPKRTARNVLEMLAAVILLGFAITTAGIGFQYRSTAAAEEETYQLLAGALPRLPRAATLIVISGPTFGRGEMPYFGESNGIWLENRLLALRPDIHAFVVASIELDGRTISMTVDRPRLGGRALVRLPISEANLFYWCNGRLVEAGSQVIRTCRRTEAPLLTVPSGDRDAGSIHRGAELNMDAMKDLG